MEVVGVEEGAMVTPTDHIQKEGDEPKHELQTISTKPVKRTKLGISKEHPIAIIIRDTILPPVRNSFERLQSKIENGYIHFDEFMSSNSALIDKLHEYNALLVFYTICGSLLVLFGKHFIVTFTIVEAFRHGGIDEFFNNVKILADQFVAIRTAVKEDDELDEDGSKF
jgi:hypothetical protein